MFERKFEGVLKQSASAEPVSTKESSSFSAGGDEPAEKNFFSAARDDSARDEQITFRLKSVAGIGLGMLLVFGMIEALFGGGARRPAAIGNGVAMSRPFEDRSAERVRSKVGIFERVFCKGLQRSSFCPSPDDPAVSR